MEEHTMSSRRQMLNKVPEITLYFWIIKVLCTTVGETAADFLDVNLNFGLTGTSILTGIFLAVVLFFQFHTHKYIPGIYWLAVALVSVFGTLVTDNLTDAMGVPLEASTVVFSVLLALTFVVWYLQERTLSIHSINTTKREAFYWLAILVTFALGTASGDLMAEGLGLGYLLTGIIVASVIVIITVAWKLGLHSVLAFWLLYILTRPLGASIGDYLSQSADHGGLGLGPTVTSEIFLGAIVLLVVYLSLTKKDVITGTSADVRSQEKAGLLQTVIVLSLLIAAAGVGYQWRQSTLNAVSSATAQPFTTEDLGPFRVITQDTLTLVNAGDLSGAKTRIGDLEFEWDNAEALLWRKNKTQWTIIDDAIDAALREVRAVRPDAVTAKASLEALLGLIEG